MRRGFSIFIPMARPPIPIGGTGVETFSNKFALFEMKLENIIISKQMVKSFKEALTLMLVIFERVLQ